MLHKALNSENNRNKRFSGTQKYYTKRLWLDFEISQEFLKEQCPRQSSRKPSSSAAYLFSTILLQTVQKSAGVGEPEGHRLKVIASFLKVKNKHISIRVRRRNKRIKCQMNNETLKIYFLGATHIAMFCKALCSSVRDQKSKGFAKMPLNTLPDFYNAFQNMISPTDTVFVSHRPVLTLRAEITG